jgi:hypothetical protein
MSCVELLYLASKMHIYDLSGSIRPTDEMEKKGDGMEWFVQSEGLLTRKYFL